jgi:DNA-binding PadR family transcriptional regulator
MRVSEPISDHVFHILLSLRDEPRHGYGIIQAVGSRTGGAFTIGSGTLYSAIKRMESDGWIERVEGPAGEDPRRKYYWLTAVGRKAMLTEALRLTELAGYARVLLPERDT